MNTTQCKRGSQNRYPYRNHFLTALFVAVMVMISTVPAFAVEATASTSTPDTEVSISTTDLIEDPAAFPDGADISEATSAPTSGPATTIEELLDAIAHANANDVIEFDGYIQAPSFGLVLGRTDCPVTIRRASSAAHILLWEQGEGIEGNVKVQNITFDGAGFQSNYPILCLDGSTQIIERCNFVNCIADGSSTLEVLNGNSIILDCHFTNNIGFMGAHLRVGSRKATIENCTFTGGFASDTGSVYIGITEKTFLTGCTISGNAAGERGGGIYIEDGELIIAGCKIYGNTANGVADDITKSYWSLLSLADDYAALVELYKPDGVIPNKWTVDSRFDVYRGTNPERADMVFSMTFADDGTTSAPLPTSITIDKSELTLDVGETDTLMATLHPEGTSSNVQWASSDPTVVSVTDGGFITAHSTGTALITVTATDGGASASCYVNVQAVPAKTYSISISVSPVEGGVANGDGQYEEGVTATVTAVPNEGFRFLAWTEADIQISTEAYLTFTVSSDRNLTAIFEPISKPVYAINVIATVGGAVTGEGTYEQGNSITLTATPESGYLFIGWMENGEQISTDEHFTFTVNNDRNLTAVFELILTPTSKPTYIINISAATGGSVSGAGKYELGSSVTLTATPESGYYFIGWTENNELISPDESFTFITDRDRTFAANFAPITQPTYTINISATVGGTVIGGGKYAQGSSVTLIAIPENEYLFVEWTENGEQASTDESFTFVAEQDRTLVANFKPLPKPTFAVQVNSTQGGIAEGGGSYEEGESVTVNAVPDAGYRFLRWEENGVQVFTEAQYSFTAEADRTLVAVFDLVSSTSYFPTGANVRPVSTSMSSQEEIKKPILNNGKAVLIAPDDLFWSGYKTGRSNGTEIVTRADLAQLVYFMMDNESLKIYGAARSPFRDVEPGAWYDSAVGTMLNTGIMVGCGDGLFCPNRTLTWSELLTVFARFAEDKPLTEYYTGAHWAKDSINKAFTLGWLEYSEAFDPGKVVTTGEMANLIQAVFRWNNE